MNSRVSASPSTRSWRRSCGELMDSIVQVRDRSAASDFYLALDELVEHIIDYVNRGGRLPG